MKAILVAVLLVASALAQSPVEEAKAKIEKQHHERLVQQAQDRLVRKAELEAELRKIDAELAQLADGKGIAESPVTVTFSNGGGNVFYSCPK